MASPYDNVTPYGNGLWQDTQGNLYDGTGRFVGTVRGGVSAVSTNTPMSGAGGSGGMSPNSQTSDYWQQIQDAINSGNQRQYDLAVGGLMGVFNGAPTLAAKKQYGDLGSSLVGTAAGLHGPKNYMDYIQYTNGGKNLEDQLYGQPRAAFSAPSKPLEPISISDIIGQLGLDKTPNYGGGGVIDAKRTNEGEYDASMGGGGSYSEKDIYGGIMPEGFTDYTGTTAPTGQGANGTYLWRGQNPYAQKTDEGALANIWNQYLNSDYGGNFGSSGVNAVNQYGFRPGLQQGMQFAYNSQDPTKSDTANYSPTVPGMAANAQNDPSGSMRAFFQDILNNRGRWVNEGQNDQNSQMNQEARNWLQGTNAATTDAIMTKTAADPNDTAMYGLTDNQGNFWKVYQGADGSQYKVAVPWQINPNHINAANWDAMGDTGRSLVESIAGKQGWDMSDFENQINAQRPVGAATTPGATATRYAPLGMV